MKQIVVILSIIFILTSLPAKETKKQKNKSTQKNSDSWSEYLGEYDSFAASDKCRSIGMRIPTLKEWKFAYSSGKMKGWEGGFYWIETDAANNNAVAVIPADGGIILTKEGLRHLRCIL